MMNRLSTLNTPETSSRVPSTRNNPETSGAEDTAVLHQVIITIDGPAGTGKSTAAHGLAKRIGLEFLDTGAMYRAAALLAIEADIDPKDGPAVAKIVRGAAMHFDWESAPPRLYLGDRDVSRRIRELDVGAKVSTVSKQSELREVLVEHQRRIAERHPRLVSEGRDQGSVVFPHADVRFFLDATPEERARRRVAQFAADGRVVAFEDVLREIEMRDHLDSTREDGPLIKPEGAIEIDTGPLSETEVVDALERHVRNLLPPDAFEDGPDDPTPPAGPETAG